MDRFKSGIYTLKISDYSNFMFVKYLMFARIIATLASWEGKKRVPTDPCLYNKLICGLPSEEVSI